MSGYCEQCDNQQCIIEIEDFIYKVLCYCNIITDDESAVKKIIIEQGTNLIKRYGGEMSLEPDKIYLHDPHGVFDEAGHGGKETAVWSEDRISEGDYEYIRSHQSLNSNALLKEMKAAFDELLIEAMHLYLYYPNNFRKTADEYFCKEIELQKKLTDYLA